MWWRFRISTQNTVHCRKSLILNMGISPNLRELRDSESETQRDACWKARSGSRLKIQLNARGTRVARQRFSGGTYSVGRKYVKEVKDWKWKSRRSERLKDKCPLVPLKGSTSRKSSKKMRMQMRPADRKRNKTFALFGECAGIPCVEMHASKHLHQALSAHMIYSI